MSKSGEIFALPQASQKAFPMKMLNAVSELHFQKKSPSDKRDGVPSGLRAARQAPGRRSKLKIKFQWEGMRREKASCFEKAFF